MLLGINLYVGLILLLEALLSNASAASSQFLDGIPMVPLRAASKRSDLQRRDGRIVPTTTLKLPYLEGMDLCRVDLEGNLQPNEHFAESPGRQTVFSSTVSIEHDKPVLAIEEIDDLLTEVDCLGSQLILTFKSAIQLYEAWEALESIHGSFVITAHHSCNEDGERGIYR